MTSGKKKPTLGYSILVLVTLIAFLAIGMAGFKIKLQVMMFLSWVLMGAFAVKLGISYNELENGAFDMLRKAMQALALMAAVGLLIGSWIAAGTVPTLIYAGLKVISPKFFLVTTLIFCSFVSLATGSSWGTMGTAGLATMGIGAGLGIPAGMTAGAVISGAYFGDKMSPLSDSTNLAAAVSGTDLFTHIKQMLYTTVPSYIISMIIFLILGFKYGVDEMDYSQVSEITTSLNQLFNIGIIPLIPALIVLGLLIKGKSPVLSILIGGIAGAVVAILYQGVDISTAFGVLWGGYHGDFGSVFLNKLLNRGGITGMLGVVALMIFALGLGGMVRVLGIMETILEAIANKIKSVRSLVASTLIVSYISSIISGSMAFAAVMTATLMGPLFEERKLKPENLSRIIEDAGTLGAPLIPWSTNGIFTMSMLQ
ncbi:MAG: Na+/H+ antiporter NhaC, partial [Clostridia bacterium]|nr:Na+/H+ antiporter NhaC [Clostridia bacterium]